MMPPLPLEWFGKTAAPLEIDFGCHRGAFLLGMASLHRGVNFLGIEKQIERVEKCNSRAERLGLANTRAIQGVGAESLKELPAASVSVFHLYFPDPWPKRRHASRRVFQKNFLADLPCIFHLEWTFRLFQQIQHLIQHSCLC